MLKCKNCGYELANTDRFCSKCGTKVESVTDTSLTLREKDVVANILKLEEEWFKCKQDYTDFDIPLYSKPKPDRPPQPERPLDNLIEYPELMLESLPDAPKVTLPPLPDPPKWHNWTIDANLILGISVVALVLSLPCLLVWHSLIALAIVLLSIISILNFYPKVQQVNEKRKKRYEAQVKQYEKKVAEAKEYARKLIYDAQHDSEYLAKVEEVKTINQARKEAHKAECANIDARNYETMRANDEKYKVVLDEWKATKYVDYLDRLSKWEDSKNAYYAKQEAIKQDKLKIYKQKETELISYIHDTNVVPSAYLPYGPLSAIYETLRTSNFSIKDAIDLYDRAIQRELTIKVGQSVAQAIQGLSDQFSFVCGRLNEQTQILIAQAQIMADNNSLLDDISDTAYRTRRDMDIGMAVGALQRHKTNKTLKEINNKL